VKLPNDQLKFGATFADHMLDIDWTRSEGWKSPRICPYGPLPLDPSASVFHYALECFEGMKAYLDEKDRIRLFRPMKNMDRLDDSMRRLAFPVSARGGCRLGAVQQRWVAGDRQGGLFGVPQGSPQGGQGVDPQR
jgi:hypothetical protein